MKQVFSNLATIAIQGVLSLAGVVTFLWYSYSSGLVPNYGGMVGILEFVAWFALANFVSLSVVGGLLYGLNLLFYYIQVQRHGYPHEEVENDP